MTLRTLGLAAALAFSLGSAAQALTYTASRDVGNGHVDILIETDGTLGALTEANFVDWVITVTDPAGSFTLTGPASGGNSYIEIQGAIVRAKPYWLTFNLGNGFQFPSSYPHLLFRELAPTGGFRPYYCLIVGGGCTRFAGAEEALSSGVQRTSSQRFLPNDGLFVIAANGAPPVPEPATWALLVSGFGFAGAALRRARRACAAT